MTDAPEIRKEFSRRLQARLRELGMNQSELADATGLSKDAISTYTRKRSLPGRDNLRRIADALKTEPEQLMPKAFDEDVGVSPVTLTMIGGNRVRIRVDAEMTLDAATRILSIINQTADAEGGR
jgi:transcriptional regulator with XRE-family HTH domain